MMSRQSDENFKAKFRYLVVEKLQEFDTFLSFLAQNPDVSERYKIHKTYEILKDDTRD